MYGFARPLERLCALALLQLFTRGVLAKGSPVVETLNKTDDLGAENDCFSPPWLEQYKGDDTGCELGRGSYTWRPCGFGSNINNMLDAWVYALAVRKWSDISFISKDDQLQNLTCFNESEGSVSLGWGCLFTEMPHLCVFDTAKAWQNHMNSANVSARDLRRAGSSTRVRQPKDKIDQSLQDLDVDHLGALAVMAKYLWSYMTPWLRHDVDAVIHAEKVEGLPFLALHVRRGDKIIKEAHAFPVKKYMMAAVAYVEEDTTLSGVDGIKAIWVASDDPNIVGEVRTLAPTYFPSVRSEAIVSVFDRTTGESNSTDVPTRTASQDYRSSVYIMADLDKLAAADIFVGTFSSNMGRLVVLMREGLGKARTSAISLDRKSWYPGRQRALLLD